MNTAGKFLEQKLQERKDNASIRNLSDKTFSVDFCSNDYLGFARSEELKKAIEQTLQTLPDYHNGAGGSRLLSGNTGYAEETEQYIADFHGAEAGLIFNSGYDANVGLLSSVPQKNDTIITDELIHASIIDGCRLSYATRYKFKHNDLNDLEEKLKRSSGNIYIVVESVYSMDGDQAPLPELVVLCRKYSANLIVDEAHATGIFGKNGAGLVSALRLENEVFARVVTFGKALGVHGAIVLGSKTLRHFLINFARSFIYTTAAPLHNLVAIKCAYRLLLEIDLYVVHQKIGLFVDQIKSTSLQFLISDSPIQGVLFSSNLETKTAALLLQNKGYDVRAILSPTVAAGKERLRICLHGFNSDEEITSFVQDLKELKLHG